jgi:hypothetical protein
MNGEAEGSRAVLSFALEYRRQPLRSSHSVNDVQPATFDLVLLGLV